jgi:pimeloyl-ACP methyl ester carboxylesterase
MLNDVALSIFGPLAKAHRVIAFDRPGFGYSERPRDRVWTPEEQAALVRAALRALDVDRPVLYGHSFGAPVVVTFALMYPEETRGEGAVPSRRDTRDLR